MNPPFRGSPGFDGSPFDELDSKAFDAVTDPSG